jgi:hypothetical protein
MIIPETELSLSSTALEQARPYTDLCSIYETREPLVRERNLLG